MRVSLRGVHHTPGSIWLLPGPEQVTESCPPFPPGVAATESAERGKASTTRACCVAAAAAVVAVAAGTGCTSMRYSVREAPAGRSQEAKPDEAPVGVDIVGDGGGGDGGSSSRQQAADCEGCAGRQSSQDSSCAAGSMERVAPGVGGERERIQRGGGSLRMGDLGRIGSGQEAGRGRERGGEERCSLTSLQLIGLRRSKRADVVTQVQQRVARVANKQEDLCGSTSHELLLSRRASSSTHSSNACSIDQSRSASLHMSASHGASPQSTPTWHQLSRSIAVMSSAVKTCESHKRKSRALPAN